MKHLKLFEEYNEFYQRIESEEYKSRIEKLEKFTDVELDTIKDTIRDLTSHNRFSLDDDGATLLFKIENYQYKINKTHDEWFIMTLTNPTRKWRYNHYKCDQITGLIEFLKISL